MALKATVSKAEYDALPEAVRKEYAEKDGSFALAVDGLVAKTELDAANTKLTEFRDTNRGLMSKIGGLKEAFGVEDVDELKTKFKDIDPVKVAEQREQLEKLKGKGVTKPEELEGLIKSAVDAAVTPLRTELQTEKTARAEAQQSARTSTLRARLSAKALEAGARPNAVDVIVDRAMPVFDLGDNSEPVAKDGHYSADKPAEKIGVDEWLTSQSKGALDFAFETSTGTGARNMPGGPGGAGKRTISVPAGQPLQLSEADSKAVASGELVVNRT